MRNNSIQIKDTVKFVRLTRPILRLLNLILDVWTYHELTPTITSANDSKHSVKSLHYKDMALDIRIKDIHADKLEKVMHTLKTSIGESWDVVLESDHIHAEFQPK